MEIRQIRRAARELALNVIYQADATGVPFDEALETALEFVDLTDIEAKGSEHAIAARGYASQIALGVKANRDDLDMQISQLARGWPLERQSSVDRNILRIALYEIIYVDDVPPLVSVDEAVELAKKYSTAESGKFVNGILAGYLREHSVDLEKKDLGSKDS